MLQASSCLTLAAINDESLTGTSTSRSVQTITKLAEAFHRSGPGLAALTRDSAAAIQL
jgi:hypothetical protein